MTYRSKAQAWYSSRRWKARRLAQLRADNHLCVYCAKIGKTTPATVADHVVPHKGDELLFWTGALQSLCSPCHDSVKRREEGGRIVTVIGADGWPITNE